MKKWKVFVPLLALMVFVFSTSATVWSQGMSPHSMGERFERKSEDPHRKFREGKPDSRKGHSPFSTHGMKESLNLDEKQAMKMKKLFREYQKDVILKKAHLKIAQIELEEAISADKFVLSAIEKKVKAKETLSSDLAMVRIRALAGAKDFLSKDQFKLFMSRVAHRMKGRGHGMTSRHGRSGGDPHKRSGKSHGFGGFGGTDDYD